VGLKLNGTHQLLAHTDDVNLLGNNIDTIKKNTKTLIDASKEIGLETNVEKTKYRVSETTFLPKFCMHVLSLCLRHLHPLVPWTSLF
jgi:hypothetical protein